MNLQKLKSDLHELEELEKYKEKIKKVIELSLNEEVNAKSKFEFIRQGRKTPAEITKIFAPDGTELDFSSVPSLYHNFPFMIIPNAYKKVEMTEPNLAIEVELKADLLIYFFIYLLQKIEERISILKQRLSLNEKK